jgi:hypothetical protein
MSDGLGVMFIFTSSDHLTAIVTMGRRRGDHHGLRAMIYGFDGATYMRLESF